MTRAPVLALSVLAAACSGRRSPVPATPPISVVAAPTADPVEGRPPAPTPAVSAPVTVPIAVPRFAQPDVDVDQEFPLRAKIRRTGPLYLTHDGDPVSPGDGRAVLIPVRVLDGDVGGSPRRPRLLCITRSQRVAAYAEAADLTVVALAGAVLVRSATLPAVVDDATPGVHFVAGAEITLAGGPPVSSAGATGQDATVEASYQGLFLRSAGYIARDHVDVVYTEAAAPFAYSEPNGELTGNVWLLDRPGGKKFIEIARRKDVTNQLLVRTLGPTEKRFVLIRYDEYNAYAVGWAPRRAVRDYDPADGSGGFGVGGVSGGVSGNPQQVQLARGTLLTDDASGEVVGVITADEGFDCEGDCEGDRPLVKVWACTSSLTLTARVR